jgi:hypothetical protein
LPGINDRKKKKRVLAKAGIVHAAGWIKDKDQPKFEALVDDASEDVRKTLEGLDK